MFFKEASQNSTLDKAKKELWTEIAKKLKTPKIVAITARSGKIILKPQDKETADILRGIIKSGAKLLTEDRPLQPRVILDGIDATMMPEEVSAAIASQNPHLEVQEGSASEVIMPIFKRGPRERTTVSWVI